MNQEELLNLEPQILWKNFVELTKIPRPSKHEQKVVEFLKLFASDNNLKFETDKTGNVLIKKPATIGMENKKGIILQGHLDMVPQKSIDKIHDFEKDPIEAYVDNGWVKAKGTTLGADNGIGIAAILSVLESTTLKHGPIEALFTIDEETGLNGAFGLGFCLNGEYLLNLDSEEEGELCIGCAGGVNANINFTYTKVNKVLDNHITLRISITGLKGGHSGVDIALGRGNANKLLFRFLYHISKLFDIKISNINGGSLPNAIPREASADIVIPTDEISSLSKCLEKFEDIYHDELEDTEPELKINIEKIGIPEFVIDPITQNNIIKSIYSAPNGVIRMSTSMKDLVETSSNLAIIKFNENTISITVSIRSSINSAKDDVKNIFESIFTLAGANINFTGDYPGWKSNVNSKILYVLKNTYLVKFGTFPKVKAIHAGLECGVIGSIYSNLDMISFGPTIMFPHSPDEKVEINSVQKFWVFLIELLKK